MVPILCSMTDTPLGGTCPLECVDVPSLTPYTNHKVEPTSSMKLSKHVYICMYA